MDVRGPTNRHGAHNHLSPVNRESLRPQGAGETTAPHVTTPGIVGASGSEANRLVRELQQLPEVREEMVQAAIAKLRRGDFDKRESAERTAEAILKTYDRE